MACWLPSEMTEKLRITARNLDRDGLSRYVQSATLNGADLPCGVLNVR